MTTKAETLDDLFLEVASAENFVTTYQYRFREKYGSILAPSVDAALVQAGLTIEEQRIREIEKEKASFEDFCSSLDLTRSAKSLAAEEEAILRNSLMARRQNVLDVLAGMSEAERDVVNQTILIEVQSKTNVIGSLRSPVERAEADPEGYKAALERGCSKIGEYTFRERS